MHRAHKSCVLKLGLAVVLALVRQIVVGGGARRHPDPVTTHGPVLRKENGGGNRRPESGETASRRSSDARNTTEQTTTARMEAPSAADVDRANDAATSAFDAFEAEMRLVHAQHGPLDVWETEDIARSLPIYHEFVRKQSEYHDILEQFEANILSPAARSVLATYAAPSRTPPKTVQQAWRATPSPRPRGAFAKKPSSSRSRQRRQTTKSSRTLDGLKRLFKLPGRRSATSTSHKYRVSAGTAQRSFRSRASLSPGKAA